MSLYSPKSEFYMLENPPQAIEADLGEKDWFSVLIKSSESELNRQEQIVH